MAPERDEILRLARAYLPEQGWFRDATSADQHGELELLHYDVLSEDPGLARAMLERAGRHFQLLVGWHIGSEDTRDRRDDAVSVLGVSPDGDQAVIVYEALSDEELALLVLELATGGAEHTARVRVSSSRSSHASLVFDERLFMKCYRVIEEGTRKEAELLFGLDDAGFNALLAPVARWHEHGHDLALVREFLPNALEGRSLALTSLRDLLGGALPREDQDELTLEDDADNLVAQAGGDFAAEMARLGATTAHLHVAIGTAFGTETLRVDHVRAAARTEPDLLSSSFVAELESAPGQLGMAVRILDDFHLRRVMRSETGWLIVGFGDDPLYVTDDSPNGLDRLGSPLEDVAYLFFSLGEVAREALEQRPVEEAAHAHSLTDAWARRNRGAFLRGYLSVAEVADLIPSSGDLRDQLLGIFETCRERRYEATPADG